MSVRFPEITLTAIMTDERTAEQHRFTAPGHLLKEDIRKGRDFALFCEKNPRAVFVAADVSTYIFGHSADERDADEDHLKMMDIYNSKTISKFVNLTNVEIIGCSEYYYLPPFDKYKAGGKGFDDEN